MKHEPILPAMPPEVADYLSALMQGKPSSGEVMEYLKEIIQGASISQRRCISNKAQMREIVRAVSQFMGVSVDEIMSRDRTQRVAWTRQAAMWLIREMTDASYPQIGQFFERDHTTVLHAVEAVEGRMTWDRRAALMLIRARVAA